MLSSNQQFVIIQPFPNDFQVMGMYINSEGSPALVMEFADGGCMNMRKLNKVWSGNGKDERRRKFALGIVSALSYMHEKNVIHRDLKPDNILCFGEHPTAKISDFGLAKVN